MAVRVGKCPPGCVLALLPSIAPNPAVCGNYLVEAGEACDDGNANDGDYCAAALHGG